MAVLDQLTLSNAAPRRNTSLTGRFRRRIIEAIGLQIEMAEAEANGTEFQPTRNRWIKNDAGVKEQKKVPLRVSRWWWIDDAGITRLAMRQGRRLLEIAPGKTSIEIGTLADLSGKLAILRDAVRAGELDGCMSDPPTRRPKKAEEKRGHKQSPRRPPGGPRKGFGRAPPSWRRPLKGCRPRSAWKRLEISGQAEASVSV